MGARVRSEIPPRLALHGENGGRCDNVDNKLNTLLSDELYVAPIAISFCFRLGNLFISPPVPFPFGAGDIFERPWQFDLNFSMSSFDAITTSRGTRPCSGSTTLFL